MSGNAKQRRARFRAEWRRVRDGGMVCADPRRAPAWTKKSVDELIADVRAVLGHGLMSEAVITSELRLAPHRFEFHAQPPRDPLALRMPVTAVILSGV